MWLRTDYVHAPQRCVSIIAFGTYGDVARCGWEFGIGEQWQIKKLWNQKRGAVLRSAYMRALFLGILPYSPSLAEGAGGGLSC